MDPEERRAARLAAVRAQRGTTERERQIADLEAHRRIEPTPRDRSVRVRRTAPPPKRSGGTTAQGFFGHPWSEWHDMVGTGVGLLIDCAERRSTTTADELWQRIAAEQGLSLGDPTLPMPFLLRDITNRKRDETGLVLAALVTDHDAFAGLDPRPTSRERHLDALYTHYAED